MRAGTEGQRGGEFDLIARHFGAAPVSPEVVVGIGDDAAVLRPAERGPFATFGHALQPGRGRGAADGDWGDPETAASLGHRLLCGAMQRAAAAGVRGRWLTLSLTLPAVADRWLGAFSHALLELAGRSAVTLVGGDTTRGPRALVAHLTGSAPGAPLPGPRPGDLLYLVGGSGGETALALLAARGELRLEQGEEERVRRALRFPPCHPALGPRLAATAHAATPAAEGVSRAVRDLVAARGSGATVRVQRLPLSPLAERYRDAAGGRALALEAPEEGALVVAVPEAGRAAFEEGLAAAAIPAAWIGRVESRPGVRCVLDDGGPPHPVD